jgi:hypothetical protein
VQSKRKLISAFFALSLLFQSSVALAHRPYFKDMSPWIALGNQEYKLQGWYGGGIFFQDPMRIILIHKNSALSAYTELGYDGEADCPTLENCWVSIRKRDNKQFVIYRLQPEKMKRVPDSKKDHTAGGPKDLDGASGFEPSMNYHGTSLHFLRWKTLIAWVVLMLGVAGVFYAGAKGANLLSRVFPSAGAKNG